MQTECEDGGSGNIETPDHRTIPLLGGWSFSESSRQNGISYYALVSPDGVAGSDEYHEDELKGVVASRKSLAEIVDVVENLVIGIGMGWDLDGLVEATKDAIAAHEKNEKDFRSVLTS